MSSEKELQRAIAKKEREVRARASRRDRPVGAHGAMGWWLFRRQQQVTPEPAFSDLYSLSFDGVDEYAINASAYAAISSASKSALTVACWFYFPTASPNPYYIYSLHRAAAGQVDGFSVSVTGANVVELNCSGHATATLTTPLVADRWYLLVSRYNGALSGASRLRGWICEAGGTIADDTASSAAAATIPLSYVLGKVVVGGMANVSSQFWPGKVSEWAMWDGALSDAQIASLESGGLPVDMTAVGSPVVVWRMGDVDGDSATGTIADATGNGHDLTPTNMEAGDLVEDAPA